jgi:hypothetical protein
MVSGEAPLTLETTTTRPAANKEKRKAMKVVIVGLEMVTAPTFWLDITPEPKIITEKAAPNAAA